MSDIDMIRNLCNAAATAPASNPADLYPKAPAPPAPAVPVAVAEPAASVEKPAASVEKPVAPAAPTTAPQPVAEKPAAPVAAEPAKPSRRRAATPPPAPPVAPVKDVDAAVAAIKPPRDYQAEREALVSGVADGEPAGTALVATRGFTVWTGKGETRKMERRRQLGLENDDRFLDRVIAANGDIDHVVVKNFDPRLAPLAFAGLLEVLVTPDQLKAAAPGMTINLEFKKSAGGNRAHVRMVG